MGRDRLATSPSSSSTGRGTSRSPGLRARKAIAASAPPARLATRYTQIIDQQTRPAVETPSATAGLNRAPEMCAPAKTIAASTRPMASGARLNPDSTVVQIVKTRKKVPMNSVAYLRNALTSAGSGRQDLEQAGRPEPGHVLVADEDGRHH